MSEAEKTAAAEAFAKWLGQGPKLAKEAGCFVAIKVTEAKD